MGLGATNEALDRLRDVELPNISSPSNEISGGDFDPLHCYWLVSIEISFSIARAR